MDKKIKNLMTLKLKNINFINLKAQFNKEYSY